MFKFVYMKKNEFFKIINYAFNLQFIKEYYIDKINFKT
jgi:hypothetical protein